MNPGGRNSGSATPLSVGDIVGMETDKLMKIAAEEGLGQLKQDALKALVCCQIVRNEVLMGLRSRRSDVTIKSAR
jgi:hypothetical protein